MSSAVSGFAEMLAQLRPVGRHPVTGVEFAGDLRDRIAERLRGAPVLPTGAGHDAGVLAAAVPTAMLFVRNPTGCSPAAVPCARCTSGRSPRSRIRRRSPGPTRRS